MQTVHIYLSIDSLNPKKTEKTWGYVLECESKPGVIRNGFGVERCTYNQGVIQALLKAFGRINQTCEVHIHTENQYVLNAFINYLPDWVVHNFVNKKGQQVAEEWQGLYLHRNRHLFVPEPGRHIYSDRLIQTMKRVYSPATDIELKGDFTHV